MEIATGLHDEFAEAAQPSRPASAEMPVQANQPAGSLECLPRIAQAGWNTESLRPLIKVRAYLDGLRVPDQQQPLGVHCGFTTAA
jgi:hypothetical protein